jgi:hypothetical protein
MAHDIIAKKSVERIACERQPAAPICLSKRSSTGKIPLGRQPFGIANPVFVYVDSGNAATRCSRKKQG